MKKSLAVALCLVLLPFAAQAQDAAGVDQLLMDFKAASQAWGGPLQYLALGSFGLLAGLDLAYHVGFRMLMSRGDISDIPHVLVLRVVTLSFFTFLLLQFTTLAPLILSSLGYAAKQAGGVGFRPSDIIAAGVTVAGKISDQVSVFHPGDSLAMLLLGTIVMGCFVWIAASMVYVLVESYFIIGAGQILMLFGGSSFMQDIPINLLRTVLGIGLKLFALQLIAAAGTAFITRWVDQIHVVSFQNILLEIGQAFLLAAVTSRVPSMFERLVSHVSSGGAGDLVRAGAVMGVAAAAMSRAAGSLAGSVSALKAAGGLALAQQSAQSAQGSGPTSTAGRVAVMVGSTVRNVGSAKIEDVSRGLSGQRGSAGTSGFRMAASMNEKARVAGELASKPKPPAPGGK